MCKTLKVLFIRHGQTIGNKEKRYVGSTDEGLTIEGRNAIMQYHYPQVEAVFVSPMKRCIETAQLLYHQNQYEVVDDFRECDFGMFEYKNYQELSENKDYQRWLDSGGLIGFPNGETREEFQGRCIRAFDYVIEKAMQKEYVSIALIVHGGTIMSILDKYSVPKKDFYDWQLGNGQGILAEIYREEWKNDLRRIENSRRLV